MKSLFIVALFISFDSPHHPLIVISFVFFCAAVMYLSPIPPLPLLPCHDMIHDVCLQAVFATSVT